jgi:hypothetical protein
MMKSNKKSQPKHDDINHWIDGEIKRIEAEKTRARI